MTSMSATQTKRVNEWWKASRLVLRAMMEDCTVPPRLITVSV